MRVAVAQLDPKLGEKERNLETCLTRLDEAAAAGADLLRDGDELRNSAVLVGPDGLVGSYRKTHLRAVPPRRPPARALRRPRRGDRPDRD